jgi:hypothetical protein
VLVDGAPGGDSVVVPFTGADHDWSAVELGAVVGAIGESDSLVFREVARKYPDAASISSS